jgi:hypothetical protein
MNYFLLLIILCMCGGFYYIHGQDQQQIVVLQKQVDDLSVKSAAVVAAQARAQTTQPRAPVITIPAVAVLLPDTSRSAAIDTAAAAATTAQTANSLGTITTLDGKTYQDCKILKVEADGITFSHAEGITKVLFPMLRPEVQKQYGYDPQKAVAETAAQINYQQSTQQAASAAASTPAPANTNP